MDKACIASQHYWPLPTSAYLTVISINTHQTSWRQSVYINPRVSRILVLCHKMRGKLICRLCVRWKTEVVPTQLGMFRIQYSSNTFPNSCPRASGDSHPQQLHIEVLFAAPAVATRRGGNFFSALPQADRPSKKFFTLSLRHATQYVVLVVSKIEFI